MTQRIPAPAPSPEGHRVASLSRDASDRFWRWSYIAICGLALGAAGVITRGGVAGAHLGLATVAIDRSAGFQDICAATRDPGPGIEVQSCANPQAQGSLLRACAELRSKPVHSSIHSRNPT